MPPRTLAAPSGPDRLVDELLRVVATVERCTAALPRAGFAARAALMESLEIHALDRLRYLQEGQGLAPELVAVRTRARALRRRLQLANRGLVARLRRRIVRGDCAGEALRRTFAASSAVGGGGGYDALDLLVEELLEVGPAGEERLGVDPERVAYQPTPAREILGMIDRAAIGPGDAFYDLGAGFGRVVILVALLTGARATGIEVEPAYCHRAVRSALRLGVAGASFVQADAREASLEDGTIFYLYTPFRGSTLRDVLARLERQAARRPIRVCTYGPCTDEVSRLRWLRPLSPARGEGLAVFGSRS